MFIKIGGAFLSAFFFTQVFAGIIRNDVYGSRTSEYSYEEVCKKMTKKESPLIEAEGLSYLNCMGEKIRVGKFCEEKLITDPYYIKGYINQDSKKVVCQSGREVIIKYLCVLKSDADYCDDAAIGCGLLQEKLALRLKINHSSILLNKTGKKELNCVFSPQDIKPLPK